VREFLDAELDPMHRAADLERLAARFTGQPLADTVGDLRQTLAQGIDREQFRRLHILISHLYHACGADLQLTRELRFEVGKALARSGTTTPTPTRGGDHVLLEP
jgi:hypothetical protein